MYCSRLCSRFCPYAQRTVMVLEAKGLDYVNINCQLMNKPEWLWDFTPTGLLFEHAGVYAG